MAISNTVYEEAHNLANTEKTFYPLRIPVSHWQLRHYISTPEPDLLYYASGHDIYCLNTATKKRRHIATLPFEARCTASGYGWVCVGGEELGHFAAIKLDGAEPRSTLDVDAALPVEHWRGEGGRRAASVKVERMGEDIVNSISIHRIQDEEVHLDDIVAILTNNDKTVRMYSLPQNLETVVLDLEFPVNHATISPDGHTLLAVGDVNQACFYTRQTLDSPPQIPKPHNRLTSASIEWKHRITVNLHMSPGGPTGYFTTAWSPNGQLVAVGSEGGYITVFDIGLLPTSSTLEPEGIVTVVPSSRPDWQNPHPGAVRSMMFSPEPWDLLIWAEDQDRICISDLRTGLRSRQIIKLDPKEDGLLTVPVHDVASDEVIDVSATARDIDELEADFIRRYRQLPDNATAVNFATEYIEARRRQRMQRHDAAAASLRAYMSSAGARERSALEDDPQGLTAREQQILESLRTTRQRHEARAGGSESRSGYTTYTSAEMFRESSSNQSPTATSRSGGDSSARPIGEILSSVQDSFPELSRTNAASPRPGSSHGADGPVNLPSFTALQDTVWGSRSPSGLTRLSDGSRLPRRRASVILTPPETNPPSSANSVNHGSSTTSRTLAAAATTEEEENPWRTIEEHMSLARGPLFESAQRAQAASPLPATTTTSSSSRPSEFELQAELQAERARARTLATQRERLRLLNVTERQAAAAAAATSSPGAGAGAEGRSRLPTFAQAGSEILLRRSQLRTAVYTGREIGVRTAGLAMSPDGRVLWAACEEGIFEIRMKLKGRLFWPSIDPR